MLSTTHIQVDLTPILVGFLAHEGIVVMWVHIAQVVGARACKTWHGVQLQWTTIASHPVLGATQRWLASLGGKELVDLGQHQWQLALVEGLWLSILIVVDGEWLTPIALAAEDGIAQAVVHLHLAYSCLFDIFLGLGNGVFHLQAVELQTLVARVHHDAVFGVEALFAHVGSLNQWDDGEVEMLGKRIVAAVVGWYRHDGTSAVACKHIVADVDGYLLAGNGVEGIAATEHTTHLLLYHALALGLVLNFVEIGIHGGALLGCHHLLHILALGSQHHEGNTKDCVGTSGEDEQLLVAAHDGEQHLGTLAVAYPVLLGFLNRVAPLNSVKVTQQSTGIGAHAQAPLAHHLLLHGISATHRQTLANLIVGKHCAQLGTPVHHGVAQVSDAVVHQHLAALGVGHSVPLFGGKLHVCAGVGVAALATVFLKICYKLIDGTSLVELGVIVALEHLQESPLCPLVVARLAGPYLTAPVVAETYLLELLTVAGNVLVGSDFGVLASLDGILLGGQAIGVIAHGMQHVEALVALVARIDVACNVAQRMAHMQAGTTRIREHVKNVELRPALIDVNLIGVVVLPVLLPLFLNLVKVIIHIFDLYNYYS